MRSALFALRALALVTAKRLCGSPAALRGRILTALGLAFRNGLSGASLLHCNSLIQIIISSAKPGIYSVSLASSFTCALTVAPKVFRL
jgi:hypothetical protein